MPQPNVILICGRLCCGKSTYAKRLRAEQGAVILSSDDLTLKLAACGVDHDLVVGTVHDFLFAHSLALLEAGVSVILDWGFWTREARRTARQFYESRGIPCELHYLDIPETQRSAQIASRNRAVTSGETEAFFVDEGLSRKCDALFEVPLPEETDLLLRG